MFRTGRGWLWVGSEKHGTIGGTGIESREHRSMGINHDFPRTQSTNAANSIMKRLSFVHIHFTSIRGSERQLPD